MKKFIYFLLGIIFLVFITIFFFRKEPTYFNKNPYLAQSYNNQTHWNSACLDSTSIEVAKGDYEVTPFSYDFIPNDTFGITILTNKIGNIDIYWFWAGFSFVKFK